MSSLREVYEVGLDFIEFLGERKSKTDKKELRNIYTSEFKREGGPNFSRLVYALLCFNKASVRKGKVILHAKPQVRLYYCDQWRSSTHSKPTVGSRPDDEDCTAPDTRQGAPHSSPSVNPVLTPKRRLAQEILQKLRANRPQLISDKGGIEITSSPVSRNGKVVINIELLDRVYVVRFQIVNKGQKCIHFTFYTALHRIRCFTLVSERRVSRVSPLLLCPGESYAVEVKYQARHYGCFPATMYFEFCPESESSDPPKPFCIVREIEAVVHTQLGTELGPTSQYRARQKGQKRPKDRLVEEGVPPESSMKHALKQTVKLKDYGYSAYLKNLVQHWNTDIEKLSPTARQQLLRVRGVLESPLSIKQYAQRFHLVLHLEEIQMEEDIQKYDLYNQTMKQDKTNKNLLVLEVPGVVENRPSVLRGDNLNVYLSEDKTQPIIMYKGYVHCVELERVKLGFSKKLVQKFIANMKFNVEFSFNRFPLKLQHRAVQLAAEHRLGDVLFPTHNGVKQTALPKLRIYNRDLETNPEQKAAVQHILSGQHKPAPYLIFGPPGTGKTITLVEAIKQVNKSGPGVHVLACAPSNSACDLLCERLLGFVDAHRLFRLYASSRDPRTVPQKLLKYSNWVEGQASFILPSKKTLMDYTIIVVTLITAGRLVSGGIPVGHFTHIFIDEAGQAVEPECVVGIAGLLHPEKGQLVLAGDPKQLGPVLRSPLAQQHGLGLSLLERLMTQNSLYQKNQDGCQGYDSCFVTKLLRNYRSHPAILKIPNELFYENELQVFANQMEREAFCQWEHLPKQGFPVIFHGVMGKDEREANSPSFFNVSEIEVLISYLKKLLLSQGKKGLPKLSATDIGIIAPYRKQVEKMQKALKTVRELHQWKDIKVGSVEEFQGQEKMVIMVSAVRSSSSYVKLDQDFNIGFLTNEKRFNVAMTRAKALLIVVGNPVILSKNPTWQRFFQYCEQEQGYTGFDYRDFEGEDDVVTRLASLKIHTSADEIEESAVQQHVHPEWRSEQ
ncbi:putative helicase mov-10-B.1 isoform X1 [Pangasianodon hypophthalmus]|uniref:putative helicase mov-10-B.1 isoform X1 n=1 Tax=Pangasianodon hypophthalmus TaxID=310915 RepID=UPI002307E1C1|nr:putative helicase mov-10-B.1 isoform X1 [Pangasianodon hypophthalmus]